MKTTPTFDTRPAKASAAVADRPGISTGAMVALLLGVLLVAMLAWWAIAVTGDTGIGTALTTLLRGETPHVCQLTTC